MTFTQKTLNFDSPPPSQENKSCCFFFLCVIKHTVIPICNTCSPTNSKQNYVFCNDTFCLKKSRATPAFFGKKKRKKMGGGNIKYHQTIYTPAVFSFEWNWEIKEKWKEIFWKVFQIDNGKKFEIFVTFVPFCG